MSLREVDTKQIVYKQYRYKWKAYMNVFASLVVVLLIAMLFSLNPSSDMGGGSETFYYNADGYSGGALISFSLVWAFITGYVITNKEHRQNDYVFVSNRQTQLLANLLFLVTACMVATLATFMSTNVLKVALFHMKDGNILFEPLTMQAFFTGIAGLYLYCLLFASAGYFMSTLVQWSRWIAFLLPFLLFGGGILQGMVTGQPKLLTIIYQFYFEETSFFLFFLKIAIGIGVLLGGSYVISKRLEVYQS